MLAFLFLRQSWPHAPETGTRLRQRRGNRDGKRKHDIRQKRKPKTTTSQIQQRRPCLVLVVQNKRTNQVSRSGSNWPASLSEALLAAAAAVLLLLTLFSSVRVPLASGGSAVAGSSTCYRRFAGTKQPTSQPWPSPDPALAILVKGPLSATTSNPSFQALPGRSRT